MGMSFHSCIRAMIGSQGLHFIFDSSTIPLIIWLELTNRHDKNLSINPFLLSSIMQRFSSIPSSCGFILCCCFHALKRLPPLFWRRKQCCAKPQPSSIFRCPEKYFSLISSLKSPIYHPRLVVEEQILARNLFFSHALAIMDNIALCIINPVLQYSIDIITKHLHLKQRMVITRVVSRLERV